MSIRILSPGGLTTIQDRGRFGYQSSGIRPCGVMDTDAYEAAVELAGGGAAVLEMTMLGVSLEFQSRMIFALTGADMKATLDDIPVPRYKRVGACPGQVLKIGAAMSGCRGYLAFYGGIQVPEVMGSRSTDMKCHIGGLEGRPLKKDDILEVIEPDEKTFSKLLAEGKKLEPVTYTSNIKVRVIPGPQDDAFTEKGWHDFLNSDYEITPDSDRMGLRLAGLTIESKSGTDIVSDGIVFGSIQVTAAGNPIVLMADHQTTGGYAKIATVLSLDLPKLAQARPGDKVRFEKITAEEAQTLHRPLSFTDRLLQGLKSIFG